MAPAQDLVLDWSYGPTTFDNGEAAGNPIVAAASKLLEDVHLEVILFPHPAQDSQQDIQQG